MCPLRTPAPRLNMMTIRFRHGVAFLVGFGFSLMPTLAPLAAIWLLLTNRLRLKRADALWIASATLMAWPLAWFNGVPGAAMGLLQIAAAWLLYKAFTQLGSMRLPGLESKLVAGGLVAGLATVVGLGLLHIDALNFTSPNITQAIVWGVHPALFGHTVLVLGALIAIQTTSPAVRLASLGLTVVGILISGSREAAIAWLLVAIALLVFERQRSSVVRGIEIALMAVVVAVAVGLSPLLGWGRIGFLLEFDATSAGRNLLKGTEIANGDWWYTNWVDVSASQAAIAGESMTAYRLTKKDRTESWLRLQQILPIEAQQTYTISAWIHAAGEGRPGIQGWGQYQTPEGLETFLVSATLSNGEWRAAARGPGQLLASGVAASDGDWRRVYATFRYEGTEPQLIWYLGLAPDIRDGTSAEAMFAGFQLEQGDTLTPYLPGAATEGLGFSTARVPYWQAALQGIAERPLLGRGPDTFSSYFLNNWPERGRLHEIPAHTHNLFLQVLFERGVVGFLGLALLLLGLCWSALRRRDATFLAVVAAVLVANSFDNTLFYGGVIYPLAAAAGWRAGAFRWQRRSATGAARQAGVRLGLALADIAASALSLVVALQVYARFMGGIDAVGASVPAAAYYALILWPLMAWREGLYPGYGLTAPQELKKQLAAATYAGLIFATASLLFGDLLAVPRSVLLLLLTFSLVLVPTARGLAKRLLLWLGALGRPVVILGAGNTGRRVAKALLRTPLDGLHPLAFFDDDPELHLQRVEGLRVYGGLPDADAFAERHNVTHVIVAIPSLPNEILARLIDVRGKQFRHLQFVPKLSGIPAEDVFASNLDGMLALEIRKGLNSRANRLLKRSIDLVGGLIGGLLISPVVLALYLWVRLDSRGPGFYWSERIGENGKTFRCLKFRTMHYDADERLTEMMAKSTGIRREYRQYHKLENDPRITGAGRILRRNSLDELSQLYNVVIGDMSLVGPRPYLTREQADMGTSGEIIFQAKPGMTGYWQISGRSNVTFEDRLAMETHYVRNWSIWWDIVILVQTLPVVIRRRGAQ